MKETLQVKLGMNIREAAMLAHVDGVKSYNIFCEAYKDHKNLHGSFANATDRAVKMNERYLFMYKKAIDYIDQHSNPNFASLLKEKEYHARFLIDNRALTGSDEGIAELFGWPAKIESMIVPTDIVLRGEGLCPVVPSHVVYSKFEGTNIPELTTICKNVETGRVESHKL